MHSEFAGENIGKIEPRTQLAAQDEGADELALEQQKIGGRRTRIPLAEELRPALGEAACEQVWRD